MFFCIKGLEAEQHPRERSLGACQHPSSQSSRASHLQGGTQPKGAPRLPVPGRTPRNPQSPDEPARRTTAPPPRPGTGNRSAHSESSQSGLQPLAEGSCLRHPSPAPRHAASNAGSGATHRGRPHRRPRAQQHQASPFLAEPEGAAALCLAFIGERRQLGLTGLTEDTCAPGRSREAPRKAGEGDGK